jgi:hypothetical protein
MRTGVAARLLGDGEGREIVGEGRKGGRERNGGCLVYISFRETADKYPEAI